MKQFIYSFLMLFFIGLTSCQDAKEPLVVTDEVEQQASERHSCCDTTKMESISTWTGNSWANIKGISLPYFTNRPDWYLQPCEEECFTFDHNLGTCDNNAIVDCLNEDVNNCSNKTALSSWICLGDVECLPLYCISYHGAGQNYLYEGNTPSGCSGGARAFFEIYPSQFCEIMECVSEMGTDYLFDNIGLYPCHPYVRPIIEYQLVAKTTGYTSCECYPAYEEFQGYNAELWVKIWCCND